LDNPQATVCSENNKAADPTNNGIYGKNGILTKAANIISIVIGIAAVIVVIIGGLQYILSAGDPARINSAKNTILYAIIGLIVALSAQAIIVFVIRRL
jgi:hypothetical protein